MAELDAGRLAASRWRGQSGRLEVWYTSITDPVTGAGIWLHHELVAPTDGSPPFAHGWIALFRDGEPPVLERFGRDSWGSPESGFEAGVVSHVGDRLSGKAGDASWELTTTSDEPPLATFPAWAWERELLPGAQILSEPNSRFTGVIRFGDVELQLDQAPGASARIYGHGNARSWGWLHAELGDGNVCEIVTAVSKRAGLRHLPPLALVKLRLDGMDIPGDPLRAGLRLRTKLARDGWTVTGRLGKRRLEVDVRLPDDQTVDVTYVEPDGNDLVCRNSERAWASVRLLTRSGRSWVPEHEWVLEDIAHAEVGGEVCD